VSASGGAFAYFSHGSDSLLSSIAVPDATALPTETGRGPLFAPATPTIRNPGARTLPSRLPAPHLMTRPCLADPATFKWELTFYLCTWTNSLRYEYTVQKPQEELNPDCSPEYRVGYLTVPLDYDNSAVENEISLELRVSARLGCSTDDSKESCPILFYHDGGPGTNDRSAIMNTDYGRRYDTIGIAQRGIGEDLRGAGWLKERIYTGSFDADGNMDPHFFLFDPYKEFPVNKSGNNKNLADYDSWPPLTQDACTGKHARDQGIPVPKRWFLDPIEDQKEIREKFRFVDAAMRDCVKDEHWKIELPGQGTGKANFLDYVGTHLLARDIDRLRESFGAEKLSCYGFSYGTAVCSTYAAQFPDTLGEQPIVIRTAAPPARARSGAQRLNPPPPPPPPPPPTPLPQICSS